MERCMRCTDVVWVCWLLMLMLVAFQAGGEGRSTGDPQPSEIPWGDWLWQQLLVQQHSQVSHPHNNTHSEGSSMILAVRMICLGC
eukprot:8348115-Pyramimonas_sp.AAC.1